MSLLLLGTASAFGLAASAGLNTTLPLLIVGALARFGVITLTAPFDALASDVALGGLLVLAGLEFVGDKLPGADSVVHALQLPLTLAAGAILFASQTTVIAWVHPGLAILVGLLTSGTIHVARMAARPVVTGTTFGAGNAVVSLTEDTYAAALVATAVFAPAVVMLLLIVLVAVVVLSWRWVVRAGARLMRWLRGVPTAGG